MVKGGDETVKDKARSALGSVRTTNMLLAVILVVMVIIMFLVIFKKGPSEKFVSYTSGANQRFQQENTDPSLGRQFGPYNFDKTAEAALLGRGGREGVANNREAPVVYNTTGSGYFDGPRPTMRHAAQVPVNMADTEMGLAPGGDSAVNGEGTPTDRDVEDLMAELYG